MAAVRDAEQGEWEGREESTSNREPRSEWVSPRKTLAFSNPRSPFHPSSCNPSPMTPNGTTKAPLTTTTTPSAFSPTPTPSPTPLPLPNPSIPAAISKKTVSYCSLAPFLIIYAFNQTIRYWFHVFTLASVTNCVVILVLEWLFSVLFGWCRLESSPRKEAKRREKCASSASHCNATDSYWTPRR